MSSYYWIKLYHEILDDPKVMTLRPAIRWRFVEALLVAGERNDEGFLPDTPEYAWRVRANQEVVETELSELADAGLLTRTEGRWLVTNFAERQAPVSDAERMRRYRERKRKEEYYGESDEPDDDENGGSNEPVTQPVTHRNTDIDTDTDKEAEADTGAGAVFTAYENEIGALTPHISSLLGDWIDDVGASWVLDAIKESAEHGAQSYKYLDAILKRWQHEGRNAKKTNGSKADDDWRIVERAIKEGGAVLKEHPDILEKVRHIGGWPRIKSASSDSWPFIRREFMGLYR